MSPAVISLPSHPARSPPPQPARVWTLNEPPFEGIKPVNTLAYQKSRPSDAIVLDFGSSNVRAGWSFDSNPILSLPPLLSKYRDRKINRNFVFCGSDVFADGTARGQSKNAYELGSNIINNWDVVEGVLDYCFIKLGLDGQSGSIDRPIVMTEPVANLAYARKTMSEVLFECYGATSVAYGIDSLFAYRYNKGSNGLVISSSHSSTHVIPVINSAPILPHATRLNWGRCQSAEWLLKLLRLKYPNFPGKISDPQAEDLVRDHCYVSQDYQQELSSYLEWTGLEDRTRTIQHPYTEQIISQKTEEELARLIEKRKESGRRLQEQAAKTRLEKLIRKEQDLNYYKDLQLKMQNATNKKDVKRMLQSHEFDNEQQFEKKIKEMEKQIKTARNKDLGDTAVEEEEPPTFPLVDIPDDQLDEDGIKQKRQQRLQKAGWDARQRAKQEKAAEKARLAEEKRRDDETRQGNLESWLEKRHGTRGDLLQRIKERDRLKADLGDRRSAANQMRMKNIANLAADNPARKRRRGGDDDDFGADDNDWTVYRSIQKDDVSDDEEEEDLDAMLQNVEAQLLEHDPNFTEENTHDAESDWSKSLMHLFLHGPWPYDGESQRDLHQLHLNVERIRVPEVVFQPALAGLDQSGLTEIVNDILNMRLAQHPLRPSVLGDVFLTGGNTTFPGFEARLLMELRAVLEADAPLRIRGAQDPLLDAWRGAAAWAHDGANTQYFVTRHDFAEKGGEYIKEHYLGNSVSTTF